MLWQLHTISDVLIFLERKSLDACTNGRGNRKIVLWASELCCNWNTITAEMKASARIWARLVCGAHRRYFKHTLKTESVNKSGDICFQICYTIYSFRIAWSLWSSILIDSALKASYSWCHILFLLIPFPQEGRKEFREHFYIEKKMYDLLLVLCFRFQPLMLFMVSNVLEKIYMQYVVMCSLFNPYPLSEIYKQLNLQSNQNAVAS